MPILSRKSVLNQTFLYEPLLQPLSPSSEPLQFSPEQFAIKSPVVVGFGHMVEFNQFQTRLEAVE